ncbi:hypothetical protein GDO81_007372 [Engystomops pustulosus]|uniref:Selenocysteine lyase n=1 Tax=Engystomops pustulosus TaxID=76066 RepID=A0AAV7C7J8_ENGPU|nr:hypothetical protein GDO81_007372 [Engystomops pustulosus]
MVSCRSLASLRSLWCSLLRGPCAGSVLLLLMASNEDQRPEKTEIPDKWKVYLDYNATTPPAEEVVEVVTLALQEAWGNPSSSYSAGCKAKQLIDTAREHIARMVKGKPEDIIFTSGGTEANNMVLCSAVEYFNTSTRKEQSRSLENALPHIITSNVEHDSIALPLKHLQGASKAEITFVPVSTTTGRVEVEDVVAALRPNTCLVSIMLANNETGVIMPVAELAQRLGHISEERKARGLPPILLHTDAAQALGKIGVDVQELGVDYLTIVGHKFYGPRIGALYVHEIGKETPLLPMLYGGGQERNYRPGDSFSLQAAELVSLHCAMYEDQMRSVRDYLEQRLQAVFGNKIRFNSQFPGTDRLPNTCNVSLLTPAVLGREWLSHCDYLLASVGAACHSDRGDSPSHVLLNSGVPPDAARGAIRLSVGRDTSREDVDLIVKDLKKAAKRLEKKEQKS